MNIPLPYDSKKYRAKVYADHMANYIRYARVLSVDAVKGVCDIEWLDHPGIRRNITISLPSQGIYDIPTPGTIVLIAFDKGYNALILRVFSQNLPALNGTAEQSVAQMRKLSPGDKLFTSFRNLEDPVNNIPTTSGAELLLTNTGHIILSDINSQFWHLDPQNSFIEQSSVNTRISTEAGIIDFGLTKRDFAVASSPGQTESIILNGLGNPISVGEKALTEFRVRVTETSDTDLSSPPEINDPLVELTLGTKIKETTGRDVTRYSIEKTNENHAVAGNEIIIQLKTKAKQGFEFTVDKSGNVTMKVLGDIKFDISGKATINANEAEVDANKIRLAGDNGVVLDTFIQTFNSHTHIYSPGPNPPVATPPPTVPATFKDVSKIVKVK